MTRRGWILFGLMGVIWGIPYLLIKVAVEDVSTPVLVFARVSIGALVLVPLAIRDGRLHLVRAHWKAMALFAATEIMGPWFLLSDAERKLSSSMSGLLVAAVPTIGVLISLLLRRGDLPGPVRWLGLGIGLAGVAVLAGPNLNGGDARSVIEVLLVALCYAGSPIYAERALREVPALPLTAGCLALATVVYTPAAVLTWPHHLPSGKVLASLAGLALVCTAFAFIAFFELIAETGATRAMVITYVNPAIAVAAGVAILGESFTVSIGISFALILTGSVLATAPRPAPEPAAEPEPASTVPG